MSPARPGRVTRCLPPLAWGRDYDRGDAVADLRAGATVAVLLIPQAMAYAALAGVPPITGLYAALVSLVVYAAFGTSRFISVGPVAIDSLLTAAAVGPLAGGDPDAYLALASLLAVMVGALQVSAGLAGLGGLVNFLSVPVISGFTSAAALTIGLTQLTELMGLRDVASSSTFREAVAAVWPALDTFSPLTVALGISAIALLVVLKRVAPRLPGPLLMVSALTALVWLLELDVSVVGEVPSGLPVPAFPAVGWDDARALLPAAAAVALISYMESISTGSAFARRTRTRVEPDQELVAVGLANTAAGLMRGFPVAGGFSRGAVNFQAGARSPLSGVIAAGLIVIALFTITPLLAHLPKVALAAVIVVAVASLVDLRGAVEIGRVRRSDLVALLVTAVATLLLGPAQGLAVGVGMSLVLFLRFAARPHIPLLGQVPGERVYRNVERHHVVTRPHVVVARVDAPLSFASARPTADRLADLVRRHPEARHLVLDCSAVNTADYTGAETLHNLADELAAAGVELHLAALRGPVGDILGRTEAFARAVEAGRVHRTVPDAVDAIDAVGAPPTSSAHGDSPRT